MGYKNRACQDCSWCHDFGTHGYCTNSDIELADHPLNKLSYDDLVSDNECEGFADDLWFGG